MASRNQWGVARSDTTLEVGRCSELAPQLQEKKPMTRQEYSPYKPFVPGNAKVAPMRGPINSKSYKPPQSTLNLFYIYSIRQGIRDGLITIDGQKTPIDKPEDTIPTQNKTQEGAGDISMPNSHSLNSLKECPDTPEENECPVLIETPVKAFCVSQSSSESSIEPDCGEQELRASAPFYYKDEECHMTKSAKSRASLAEARKQFFQPLYQHIESNGHSNSPRKALDFSQSSCLP